MTTIDPAQTIGATTASKKTADPLTSSFGPDAFMKLLVAQLHNQSPDSNQDPTAWIQQLTNFSQLEQQEQTAANTAAQVASQNASTALSLIGKSVTYANADGLPVDGTVQRVDFADGTPQLTIGGKTGISPGSVIAVSA